MNVIQMQKHESEGDGDTADGEISSNGAIKIIGGDSNQDIAWFCEGPCPLIVRLKVSEHGELTWPTKAGTPSIQAYADSGWMLELLDSSITSFKMGDDSDGNPLIEFISSLSHTWQVRSGIRLSNHDRGQFILRDDDEQEDHLKLTFDGTRYEGDLEIKSDIKPGQFLVTGSSDSGPPDATPDAAGYLWVEKDAKTLYISFPEEGNGEFEWRTITSFI